MRLLVTPAVTAGATYLLVQILRIPLPSSDQNFARAFLLGFPFVVTLFSQLHRLDVLNRLEKIERSLESLQNKLARSDADA